MSRTNYIFIDYENVQDTDLDRIGGKPVKVVLVARKVLTITPKNQVVYSS